MKDRKNMTIVRYGNLQDAPVLTFKSFKELREQLIESLAWDDPEDERITHFIPFLLKPY